MMISGQVEPFEISLIWAIVGEIVQLSDTPVSEVVDTGGISEEH